MRTDTDNGVSNGGSVLNLCSLRRIRVITAPGLGSVVHQSRIISGSTAGTGFKKHIRELCSQAMIQIIDSKNISMHHLSLSFRIQCSRIGLGHISIHIPLNIGNGGFSKNLCHLSVNIIHNLFSGIVQYMLVSGMAWKTSGSSNHPIRMSPIQVGIHVDHFHFKPKAKL